MAAPVKETYCFAGVTEVIPALAWEMDTLERRLTPMGVSIS